MSTAEYRDWIGKTESRDDLIHDWPVRALAATLGDEGFDASAGNPLPPGWHWLFFLEAAVAAQLGPDGHPKRGKFLPPISLPRRMWAGGRLDFLQPLRIGDTARRVSTIKSIEAKQGRTGDLIFVTVRHEIGVNGRPAVIEEQDLVYRDAGGSAAAASTASTAKPAQWAESLVPDTTLLFRYSALTFNGHRIHYDSDYARREEGYPGLVVHGPLQSTLLLELCRRRLGKPVRRFEYRSLRPVFEGERLEIAGNPDPGGEKVELWTAHAARGVAMAATAYA